MLIKHSSFTQAQHQTLVLPDGCFSIVTETKEVRVHDGVTLGGNLVTGLRPPPQSQNGISYGLKDGVWTPIESGGQANINGIGAQLPVSIPGDHYGRQLHSFVAIGELIYLYGGAQYHRLNQNRNEKNDLFSYNTSNNVWTRLATGPFGRQYHAATVINGKMHVTGGSPTAAFTQHCVYDPLTNIWTVLADMPVGRSYHTAVTVDGKMYVCGGIGAGANQTWVYDPVLDNWTQLANMPHTRNSHAAAAINGKMYVFGGTVNGVARSGDVHVYDPVANTWSPASNIPLSRGNFTVSAVGDKAYLYAGTDAGLNNSLIYKADLWEFDSIADTWTFKSNNLIPVRQYHAACTVDGKIYVFGGINNNNGELGWLKDHWIIF